MLALLPMPMLAAIVCLLISAMLGHPHFGEAASSALLVAVNLALVAVLGAVCHRSTHVWSTRDRRVFLVLAVFGAAMSTLGSLLLPSIASVA